MSTTMLLIQMEIFVNIKCQFKFSNGLSAASFSFIIGFFKQTLQFLQLYNVKNVRLVSGAGI